MADPTQAARDKVGTFIKNLLPASSPLNQSLDAGNPSVLTAEAQKKRAEADALEAQAVSTEQTAIEKGPSPAQETEFVDQSLPQNQSAPVAPQSNLLGMYDKAAAKMGANEVAAGNAEAAVLDKQGQLAAQQAAELEARQAKADADLKMISDDTAKAQADLDSFKMEPTNFFSNKSTWQKVVGGIGLFLGSLTPEGARNIAGIIDKQIERDTEMQKQEYALKKGKVDAGNNRYKMYLDKYKDSQLATMALNREKLAAMDFQVKALQSKAKGQLAKDKLEMGRVEIAAKQESEANRMFERMQKLTQPNKTAAKGHADMEASAETVNASLDDLSELVKGTGEAIPFTAKNDTAKQLVNDIQLQLKEIKKLGVLSGSDDKRLDNYLSDPSFFKSDARMESQIKGVKDLVAKALSAQRKAIGAKDPNEVAGSEKNKKKK